MRTDESRSEIIHTFDSLTEAAAAARQAESDFLAVKPIRPRFTGVYSTTEAHSLADEGWQGQTAQALTVAESAIERVEREHEVAGFQPYWDVSGCEVDVGRYLMGEPENMIEYEIVPTTRVGRVITLCASVAYSYAVTAKAMKRRGRNIVALALALDQLGYATELWVDASASSGLPGEASTRTARFRTRVKGPNDELDASRIMFAYSHPAMYRVLSFEHMHLMNRDWQETLGVGHGYGYPTDPKQDLPDGAIYLPSVLTDEDVPDADKELLQYMRELGIITD